MTPEDLSTLKVGDLVFVAINSGITGVYQYIGIFKCHATQEMKHVFMSEYFVSTRCVLAGREKTSWSLKTIFFTKKEAEIHAATLND